MRAKINIGGAPIINNNNNQYAVGSGVVNPIVTNGVKPSTLPIVDQRRQINVFEGVKPIMPVSAGTYNTDQAFDYLMGLIQMTPVTPEMVVFASRLKELGDTNQFNCNDSRALDKVMGAIMSSALTELIDRDDRKFALLMETICKMATANVTNDSVSKWIRSGAGGSYSGSLVNQAVNAFRSYMRDNDLKGFENISKFKRHFNNFISKKSEYKNVLVSEAWSVYNNGGGR